MLPNLRRYVKVVEEKKVPKPDTRTYETVKNACKDPLLEAKLQFALSEANKVTPFLCQLPNCQTNGSIFSSRLVQFAEKYSV